MANNQKGEMPIEPEQTCQKWRKVASVFFCFESQVDRIKWKVNIFDEYFSRGEKVNQCWDGAVNIGRLAFVLSVLLLGHSQSLFLYFRLFWIAIDINAFKKLCQCWDSNHGSLMSDATSLPTAPQPRPQFVLSVLLFTKLFGVTSRNYFYKIGNLVSGQKICRNICFIGNNLFISILGY